MVQFRIQAAFFDKGTDRIGIILKAFVQALDRNHTVEHKVPRFADPADRRKTLVRFTPKGYEACRQCEAALGDYFSSVMARLEPEQLAQMEALRGALMEAILAENAARTTKPKGEPNHDKDL